MTNNGNLADVGVIGMAVMGSNLARNIASKGYATAIYNRSFERTHEVTTQHPEANFVTAESLEDFVASLARPRRIILMVQAGAATDAVIDSLIPLVDPGDIVLDGGNSRFHDTRRREKRLAELGINFIGCGISGGEEGALRGPAIMPGGPRDSYQHVGPLLESIAAQFDGSPCCDWIGPDGSGHFVKMVHNGIEYADMQLIGEAYELLRALGLDTDAIADVFRRWNAGDLGSYLIEITSNVVNHIDEKTGNPLVNVVLDAAGMKGTGTWTVQEALSLGACVPAIAESVFVRGASSNLELRTHVRAASAAERPALEVADVAEFIDDLEHALWCAKVVAYAQGLDLIRVASETYDWGIDVGTCARIWRAGCIIRAKLLDQITNEYAAANLFTLLEAESVGVALHERQAAWRRVVAKGIEAGVPMPGFASALSYWDLLRAPRNNAALLQVQRDFFGAHTYRRIDEPGVFHTRWSGDRTEVKLSDD